MKLKRIILIILMIIVLAMWIGYTLFNTGMTQLQNMTFSEVAINDKADGEYTGECTIGRWKNEVKVVIENGQITDINILADQMVVSDETRQAIFNATIAEQRVPVDAIAGATVTSNAYLRAIVNAVARAPGVNN